MNKVKTIKLGLAAAMLISASLMTSNVHAVQPGKVIVGGISTTIGLGLLYAAKKCSEGEGRTREEAFSKGFVTGVSGTLGVVFTAAGGYLLIDGLVKGFKIIRR